MAKKNASQEVKSILSSRVKTPASFVRPKPTIQQKVQQLPKQAWNYLSQPKQSSKTINPQTQRVVSQKMGRFAPKVAEGFTEASTLNLVDVPYAKSRNTGEKVGYLAGSVAGYVNPFNPVNKLGLFTKADKLGAGLVKGVLPRITNSAVRKVVPALAGEAVQSVGYLGAQQLARKAGLNQAPEINPNNLASLFTRDLALGVLGRGAFRGVGALRGADNIAPNAKGFDKRIDDESFKEVNVLRDLFNNSIKKKIRDIPENIKTDVDNLATRFLKTEDIDKVVQSSRGKPEVQYYRNLLNKIANKVDVSQRVGAQNGMVGYKLGLVGDVNPSITKTNIDTGQSLSSTQQYIKDQVAKQKGARQGDKGTVINALKSKVADFKSGLVDEQAAIEDALSNAEKKGGFKVLPKYDIRINGIDRVLKSRELAGQFIKDNGLSDAIKQAPDLDELNQYLIAKQATDVTSKGFETGRNLQKDKQLIEELSGVYEPLAKQVNEYGKKLLKYSVDSGLVDKKVADDLVRKYPNYVPLQRVFTALEQESLLGVGSKQVASLAKQTVVQRLKGSKREIVNPLESLLTKTQDAILQGERNKTARMLAQYKDLPGFENLIREAEPGAKNTFSYLDNGVKKIYETTPEIAAAAKSLDREQMTLIVKLLSPITRSLQLGATGLNVPFIIRNVVKDELSGFINSNRGAKTSLLNPVNFMKSVYSVAKHDDLYNEVVRNAGMGTSFDISRSAPELTVESLRSGRNATSKALYLVKNPKTLFRAIEDIVGRSEELGRIKNYAGMKEALLKEGRTLEDAQILAAQAARENTANFSRKGSFGRTLNYLIPFFNAGIQGSRQLVRSFQNNPKATTTKMVVGLFTPVAAATAWNLSDPERKRVYEDISKTEKENNILIVPPNPTQNSQGQWNVIKVPLTPGISNLAAVIRRYMEQGSGLDPVKFREVASNFIAAGTSIDLSSGNKLLSSVVPQAIKIPAESILNKNFYTGRDIVPQYMMNKPPEEQVFSDTSGTARKIGEVINTSPLKVQNTIRTSLGGLGTQLLNYSDRALASAGAIPKEQIGGESIGSNVRRSFTQSYGGEIERKAEDQLNKTNTLKKEAIQAYLNGDKETTKRLIQENNLVIQNKDVTRAINEQKNKAIEAYINGDKATTKQLIEQYGLQIKNSDVQKKAKSQAISAYKKYLLTKNDYYKQEAKRLIETFQLQITNREVQ